MAKLSNAEYYLWEYIQNNLDEVSQLSITKLAETAKVSTATIVRTLQKQGFSGYTAFRQEIIATNKESEKYKNLAKTDSDIKKAILKNEREVSETIDLVDMSLIEDAIEIIANAEKIYIFARGFSELIAKEMLVKFELLEKNTEMHDDPNIIIPLSKKLPENSVCILISLNGETPEIVEAAKNAQQKGISVISITTNPASKVIKHSDIALVGYKSDMSYFPEYEVHSRLPLQVISRIILDAYAINIKPRK